MPIYEYECLECGTHFEKLQRYDKVSLPACPQGHAQVHRLLSQPTIIFRGSGFYVTDNGRNGNGKGSRSGRKGSRTGSQARAETKTETAKNTTT